LRPGKRALFVVVVLEDDSIVLDGPEESVPNEPRNSSGLGIAIEETSTGINYGQGGRNIGFISHSSIYKDLDIGYVFLVNDDDASKIDNGLNAYFIAAKSRLKNTQPISHKVTKVDGKVYSEQGRVDHPTFAAQFS
jgi:hypothetical protein